MEINPVVVDCFEWDEKKNRANIKKHGIEFELAANIFRQPHYVYDSPKGGEIRHVAVGSIEEIIIAVIYTVRHEKIRIISARKARKKEKVGYRAIHDGDTSRAH